MKTIPLDTLKRLADQTAMPNCVRNTLDSISTQLLTNGLRIPKRCKGLKFRRREKALTLYSLGVKLEEIQQITGLSKTGLRQMIVKYPPSVWVQKIENDPIELKLKVLLEDAEDSGVNSVTLVHTLVHLIKNRS